MNLLPIFPINISHSSIPYDWNREEVIRYLQDYFIKQQQTGVVDRDLHKQRVFGPILRYMDETVAQYWKVLGYSDSFPIEMTQLWANGYNKTDHFPHNLDVDGPANITVVFYVQKDSAEMGNLFFGNPTELIWQTQPLSEERRHNHRYQELDGRTGDLVCFPSWLQHGIKPNQTDTIRYSLAGNYELKGLTSFKRMLSRKQ